MKTEHIERHVNDDLCHGMTRALSFLQCDGGIRRGFEAQMTVGTHVRGKDKARAKEDISWAEFTEMAYGYLRIPLALVFVEIVYWWATEPDASLEPLQVTLAWLWTNVSNFLWPGSAELVLHADSNTWTGVNLFGYGFEGGVVPLYIDAECSGLHEIMFLGTLMMLTPGVVRETRIRSLIGMVFIVQFLNFLRLIALYPIGIQYGEAQMNELHEMIFRYGFLIILVLFWIIWYISLERNGQLDKGAKPSLKNIPKMSQFSLRETLPRASIIALVFAALIAVWGTHEVTLNDENQKFKAIADECEGDDCENNDAKVWPNIWGRTMRLWLFSGIVSAISILKIQPLQSTIEEE